MKVTSPPRLRSHILASYRDGIFTNGNIGLTESYFVAFMLALGLSEVSAGLSIVLAQFLGVVVQVAVLPYTRRLTSLKHRLLIFLPLQALAFIPLILMGALQKSSAPSMILTLGFYWFSLLSLNPPWWRLMGHTIPKLFQRRFFSYRNLLCQLSVFIGLIASGLALTWGRSVDRTILVFLGIFGTGFLLKLLSWIEIRYFHSDFIIDEGEENFLSFKEFLKSLRGTQHGKLIQFLFFFYVTVHTSALYFNPYMLGPLGFSYVKFMSVLGISYFGQVAGSRFMQKRVRNHQMNAIIFIATLGIAINPLLWSISRHFGWILFIEFISGINWAGLNLAVSLLFYQRISDQNRTSIMSYVGLVQTTGMALGCGIGALFLNYVPVNGDKFLGLFLFSTSVRLLGFVFSPRLKFKEMMPVLWMGVRSSSRWVETFFRGK
jgi:MFS family permease